MAQQGQVKASEYSTLYGTGTSMTPKQKVFVKEYVNTLNATEAAMRAYDCKDRKVARNVGSENLTKLGSSIDKLMDDKGLSDNRILEELEKKFHCTKPIVSNGKVYQTPDNAVQLRAVEIAAKLRNLFPRDTLEVTGKDGGEIVIKVREDRELIEVQEGETVDEEE